MSQLYDLNFLNKTTTIKVQADAGAKTIDVTATSGMSAEESISIVLDDASTHIDTITEITDADTLKIKSGIPVGRHADVGAVVKTYYSFMLLQDGRKKGFRVTDAPLLPQTLITETASPSSIAPEREIQLSQVDWRKGIQDLLLSDHYRYFDSENCDARFKGRVMLSPKKLSSLGLPSAFPLLNLVDGDLAVWDGGDTTLTNWDESGNPIEKTTTCHDGTLGARGYTSSGTKTGTISQTWSGANFKTEWRGCYAVFAAWCKDSEAYYGHIKVKVSTDKGSTESALTINASTGWEQAFIYHTIESDATSLTVTLTWTAEAHSTPNYTYFDDCWAGIIPVTPISQHIRNHNFEAGALTNWTASGTAEISTTSPYEGTYCARFTGAATLTQALAWVNSLRGQTVTLTVRVKCAVTGSPSIKIALQDDDGTEYSKVFTDTTWTFAYVVKTIGNSATYLNVILQGLAETTYADDCHITVQGAYGSCVQELEFNADIVYACGSKLLKLSGGALVGVADFVIPITDMCVFKGNLYVALGWSYGYWYTSDLTIFTSSTIANAYAKHMSNVGDTQFWISDSNSTMTDTDDPTNGHTFSAPSYQVGSDSFDITGLVNHPEIVFVRKQDQVYYLSVADVIPLLPISTEANTTYVYGLHVWGDYLFVPSGINSMYLYEISTGVATVISPTRYAIGDTNYDGQVLAMCHDETYLYAVIDNGSDIRVLAGRFENVEGDTDWYWHPIYSKTSNNITCMLVSSLSGSKRLYMGTDTYTDGILLFKVSTSYSGVWLESGMEFELTGNFFTPWLTSNFPTDVKLWKSVAVTSICITSPAATIAVYYQVKGGDWVSLGACSTSAWVTGYPAEKTDTFAIGVESERIRFKFVLTTADDDYTPMIYGGGGGGYVAYGVLLAERERQIEGIIQVAPVIRLRDYVTVVTRTVSNDLSVLRALYKAKTDETVVAPDGTEYIAVFAREGYEEQLAFDEIMRNEQWWITVRLLET